MLGHAAPGVWVPGDTGGSAGSQLARALRRVCIRVSLCSVCVSLCVSRFVRSCVCIFLSLSLSLYLCSLCICLCICLSVHVSLWLYLCLTSLSLHGQNHHARSLPLAPVGRKRSSGWGLEGEPQARPDLAPLLPRPALAPLGRREEAFSPGRPGPGRQAGLSWDGPPAPFPRQLPGFLL